MNVFSSKVVKRAQSSLFLKKYYDIYKLFRNHTMIPPDSYVRNLLLAESYKEVEGAVVECGTWKGGMIGGIAKLFNDHQKHYYLFDSFEGLPEAQNIDGAAAINYQLNKDSPWYFDNCSADIEDARKAMKIANTQQHQIYKGWFNDTLVDFKCKISILRLDADWYDSTMTCLQKLFDQVVAGGIIILDDYHVWEGCTKAVHDFLSEKNGVDTICQFQNDICYIKKK